MGKVDMARIIIIIAALIIGLYLWRWLRGEYQKKGRPFAVKTALVTTAGLLIALAATGRVHWVGAFLASGLAALRFALPLLMRGLPFLQHWSKARAEQNQGDQANNPYAESGEMTDAEAREVLGVEIDAGKTDIIEAHRRLIQKLHPDRGGSDYLAAKINRAKDCLLKQFD
jgi:DnaJ family protein C protein 19